MPLAKDRRPRALAEDIGFINEPTGKPHLLDFDPVIPYQRSVLKLMRRQHDYNTGAIEILLSGGLGSAKSVLMAHIIVTHCLIYREARVCIARKALPDLKQTLFREIIDHLQPLTRGKDYTVNETTATISFKNKSEIISRSWSDGDYLKMRSLSLSAVVIEELTENNEKDKQAYDELKYRVGRVPGIKENFILSATNADSPEHWVRKYFWDHNVATRHVFTSTSYDNPFLPDWYIPQLKRELPELMFRRMVLNEWIHTTSGGRIYYAYDENQNFRRDTLYQVDPKLPICITFDFNAADKKPMSAACLQFHNDGTVHVFDKSVIYSARTLDVLDDFASRGILDHDTVYFINGDATGAARSANSLHSNYDLIRQFLANYQPRGASHKVRFEIHVPRQNPPIKARHNKLNSLLTNAEGKHSLFLYKGCEDIHQGLLNTKLKTGAEFVEDDSYWAQHITTALGYSVMFEHGRAGYQIPTLAR